MRFSVKCAFLCMVGVGVLRGGWRCLGCVKFEICLKALGANFLATNTSNPVAFDGRVGRLARRGVWFWNTGTMKAMMYQGRPHSIVCGTSINGPDFANERKTHTIWLVGGGSGSLAARAVRCGVVWVREGGCWELFVPGSGVLGTSWIPSWRVLAHVGVYRSRHSPPT